MSGMSRPLPENRSHTYLKTLPFGGRPCRCQTSQNSASFKIRQTSAVQSVVNVIDTIQDVLRFTVSRQFCYTQLLVFAGISKK